MFAISTKTIFLRSIIQLLLGTVKLKFLENNQIHGIVYFWPSYLWRWCSSTSRWFLRPRRQSWGVLQWNMEYCMWQWLVNYWILCCVQTARIFKVRYYFSINACACLHAGCYLSTLVPRLSAGHPWWYALCNHKHMFVLVPRLHTHYCFWV